ncbi:MAG TPA: hypothetical protein VGG51_03410 [Candidatus Cybelea sp.]
MTTAQPDIMGIIGSAFRAAWPLMERRMFVYWILAALTALGVVFGMWLGEFAGPSDQQAVHLEIAAQPVAAFAAIAMFFILPEVIRLVRPAFKMTFILVLAIIGIGLVVGIATEIGFVLLIWPGIWVAVKLSFATYAYLLDPGTNPFRESWALTTGHFWQTLGFMVVLSIFVGLIELVLLGLPLALAWVFPSGAVVLSPIAFLGVVYLYYVTFIAYMRWLLELRGLSELGLPTSPISIH